MQLLFGAQEEGNTHGLGLLDGRVRSLDAGLKIPQISWNRVQWVQPGAGYEKGEGADFYFVHSYVVEPAHPGDVVAVTRYGGVFPSVVRHGEIWGTQFHPEKSGPAGLRLVSGWVAGVTAAGAAALESVTA
jgi:glutamine amidotransferase